MESVHGLTRQLSQGGFTVSAGRGHCTDPGAKMDQMGHCGFDDRAGSFRIVSGTGTEINNGEVV